MTDATVFSRSTASLLDSFQESCDCNNEGFGSLKDESREGTIALWCHVVSCGGTRQCQRVDGYSNDVTIQLIYFNNIINIQDLLAVR